MRSLRSAENLKVGTERSSSSTSSPVRGLRAGLDLRSLTAKVPKQGFAHQAKQLFEYLAYVGTDEAGGLGHVLYEILFSHVWHSLNIGLCR